MKKENYLKWDEYFMGIALLSAERSKDPHTSVGDAKYLYVCHAELNALLTYTGTNLKNATIYTTLFPCNECTKALIQSGIKEVIYMSDKYSDTPSVIAAKRMMNSAGVKFTPYKPINRNIELQL